MSIFTKLINEAKCSEDYDFEKLAYSFSRSIISYLRQSEMSQKDLAERLNVSEAWISKILNAESNLTLKTLIKIARALDCKVNDITLSNEFYVFDSIQKPSTKENFIEQKVKFIVTRHQSECTNWFNGLKSNNLTGQKFRIQ